MTDVPQPPDDNRGAGFEPLTHSPGFWLVQRYALMLGVVLAFGSLAFLGVVKHGGKWFELPSNPGWFDGKLWWVGVTGAAGVLVGVLRRAFRLPLKLPGLIKELKEMRVDPSHVPGMVAVSVVSLVGGASLGPEAALGAMGGGLGTWLSDRRGLGEDARATTTISGMAGAYGGLLSAPYVAALMVIEIARPKRVEDAAIACLLASTISFAIFYPIAGSTFLGIFTLPPSQFEDWQLLAAVPLGILGALLALITVGAIAAMSKLTAPLASRTIVRSTVGGVGFGLVAVALPLTLFTGTSQLTTIINDGATLGAGLLIAVVVAKILVFALCEATGFIGGPFFPMLFVGATTGVALHELIPGLPLALTFTTLFAAVPGSLVAAPFSLILVAFISTQIGTLQTAPVAISVLIAYLALSGTGALMALAQKRAKPAA